MPGLVEQWLQRTNSAHLRSCLNALPEGSGLVRCAFVPSPPIEEQWARSVWTRPHYLRGRNAISGFLILLGSQVRRKLSQHAKVKFRPHSSSELILPSLVCLDRLDLWEWENTGKVICLKVQFVSHEMNPLYGMYFSENPLGGEGGWLTICQAIKQENVKVPRSNFGEHVLQRETDTNNGPKKHTEIQIFMSRHSDLNTWKGGSRSTLLSVQRIWGKPGSTPLSSDSSRGKPWG